MELSPEILAAIIKMDQLEEVSLFHNNVEFNLNLAQKFRYNRNDLLEGKPIEELRNYFNRDYSCAYIFRMKKFSQYFD